MSVFGEAQHNQLATEFDIQSQAELKNYQVQLANVNNPTQAQDNLVVGVDGAPLNHWNETLDFNTWAKMDVGGSGKRGLLIHGNNGLYNVSSGDDVFTFFDDFLGSSLDTTNKWIVSAGSPAVSGGELQLLADRIWNKNDITPPAILELKDTKLYYSIGSSLLVGFSTYTARTERFHFYGDDGGLHRINHFKSGGGATSTTTDWTNNSYADFKLMWDSDTPSLSWSEDGIASQGSPHTTANDIPINPLRIELQSVTNAAVNIGTIFVRDYTTVEPTATTSSPKNISTTLKVLGRVG